MSGKTIAGGLLTLVGVVLFTITAFVAISNKVNIVALGLAFATAGLLVLLVPPRP